MIKIGITGSLASGKSTASKILSNKRGPLFSADKVVAQLYRNKRFNSLISKKFKIKNNSQLKEVLKELILTKKQNLKKLEKIVQPLVRSKMREFTLKNKKKKILFYEIPLLIERRLMNFFNIIIFIKSKKKLRLRRFKSGGGNIKLFNLLNRKQMNDQKKIKFCDYVVVNEKNLKMLKEKLFTIIKKYE